ncbi:amidase [Methylobrevis pamukkalensis]|uniref:Acylamidase n=1 Tax=Methylobrevis pamukkalensis TaxID=1439726 RepID=A0A1E3H576_9HYPH|nr:amidase family protein [Methylobrevis pamukkalensis]ODN71489.1 Acylamidase [Methylobrevis pamukkalensis]
MSTEPLYYRSATELAGLLRAREISAIEVMKAFLGRIEEVNPKLNSIVTLMPESAALALAEEADRKLAAGDPAGILHGLPTAVKDLNKVKGFPTSYGTRAFAEAAPETEDALFVKRLRSAGALVIGKTNTPSFGVGTLAFNEVHGVTRNPWDLALHAGGSSGGGAAVAAGMLPIADGGDSGGSIRYPSSFCNTVGLRTSPGRVPFEAVGDGWTPHVVLGPMARSSQDAGLLLAAMAGASDVAPIGLAEDPAIFLTLADVDLSDVRIAWSKDAGGLPVSPEMRAAYAGARARLESLGCTIDDVELDLSTADRAWEAIEMFGFYTDAPALVHSRPDLFRPDYVRNIRQGAATDPAELAFATRERTAIFQRTAALLHDYDVFVTPATPVTAPPAEVEWVAEIDGTVFDRYFLWQRMACRLTMTAHPILVTPGGFTERGLPFGLQMVGRMRGEHALLSLGHAIETATGWAAMRPTGI